MVEPKNDARGLLVGADGVRRCSWCGDQSLYVAYHDEEWGRPNDDDRRLFEKICLEGFQAGLSWWTILQRREAFRRNFEDFDFVKVARFDEHRVNALLADPSIIRHRGKIEAAISNAARCSELIEERGSLAAYVWSFEPAAEDRPKRITPSTLLELTESAASRALSRDLKQRGWRFVGPTTMYAFLQSMGVVNDHLEGCAMREPCSEERRGFAPPTG